ncbi:hypothetical protein HGM15179_020597 [Zosterops borbonicus]|uniref:Uncharacterized protein n=1 Tax=Zosterops borbonicus TaxID=364589 RepID=A0A8K1DA07_9PASS|nr:hypothetical protein HGM15179_020597 [Zosterops borbonicus]
MASQEASQEGDAKLLAETFQKEGLDARYWLPKVSQILGIKSREALQHLEYEDFLKLECKHSEGEDWERLERDLHSLISGCLDDKWDQQRMQNIFRDLEDTFATPEHPSQSKSKSDGSKSKTNEAIANQEFLQLLKRLGLESHYPRKMGMGDFQTVNKTSLQDSQPSKDTELPCSFLQRLLTMDYQVRYLTCWDDSNPKHKTQNTQQSKTQNTKHCGRAPTLTLL